MKLKFFFYIKAIFGTTKGCFTVNLTKIKSKLALNFLAFYWILPGLKTPAMTDR